MGKGMRHTNLGALDSLCAKMILLLYNQGLEMGGWPPAARVPPPHQASPALLGVGLLV